MSINPRPKKKNPFRDVTPGVVLQPEARQYFQQGITRMVAAIRPSLGPLPRLVAVSRAHAGDAPELLDDGGLIARRIVALSDRDADMGAMFVRHVLWRLREEVGDGTASAAVMLQTIYDEGIKYLTAGGNAMQLREALEDFLPELLDELSSLASPIQTQQELTNFAMSICPDAGIARLLGEIFFIIGMDGHIQVEKARGQPDEREYIEGALWDAGLASRSHLNDLRQAIARLENCAILSTDLEINDAQTILPVLRAALGAGHKSLAILARKFSEDSLALMVNASRSGNLSVLGIKTPGTGLTDQFANLQDVNTLAGGRAIISATNESLENIRPDDFGFARRLWADTDNFGLVGGRGDPLALRTQLASLFAALNASDSVETRRKYQARIGRLRGGAARLLVGGATESEQSFRLDLAQHTSLVIRSAMRDGILPGGGAAYLACLNRLVPNASQTEVQSAARRILQKALRQPALVIAANAGFELHDLQPGQALDVRTGQPADMLAAGILDAAGVGKAVLNAALRGAALALTVDVLVQHASPQYSPEP